MPVIQQTFDLVPTTLAKPMEYQRPMTSTQVKKAYRKSNRGPRISRADQRRRDAAELQKQRREWEREQANIKSMAIRDKKAVQAAEEKEERRKRGLPEPTPFVRPSQARISMFVNRGPSEKRRWEGKYVVMANFKDNMREEEQPAKRSRIQKPDGDSADEEATSDSGLSELSELIEEPVVSGDCKVSKDEYYPSQIRASRSQSKTLSMGSARVVEEDLDFYDSQVVAETATTQLLEEMASADGASETRVAKNAISQHSGRLSKPAQYPLSNFGTSRIQPEGSPARMTVLDRKPLQERSGNMLSPAKLLTTGTKPFIESTFTTAAQNKHSATTPKQSKADLSMPPPLQLHVARQVHVRQPPKQTNITLPTQLSSTQIFLESHMDDFFPSPSQQVRELLSDIDDFGLASDTQICKEISPNIAQEELPVIDLLCTQDLLSSQEIHEIETPCPALAQKESVFTESAPLPFADFFLSQDFNLSPRDLEEIQLPTRKPSSPRLAFAERPSPEQWESQLARKPTSEQDTFIDPQPPYPNAPQDITIAPCQCKASSLLPESSKLPVAKATKPRFFIEKDEPPAATPQLTPLPTTQAAQEPVQSHRLPRRRFFEEKEDDLIQAAIQQSLADSAKFGRRGTVGDRTVMKSTAAGFREPVKEGARVLKRMPSESTDYGDEEFGPSCEELFALL